MVQGPSFETWYFTTSEESSSRYSICRRYSNGYIPSVVESKRSCRTRWSLLCDTTANSRSRANPWLGISYETPLQVYLPSLHLPHNGKHNAVRLGQREASYFHAWSRPVRLSTMDSMRPPNVFKEALMQSFSRIRTDISNQSNSLQNLRRRILVKVKTCIGLVAKCCCRALLSNLVV